MKLATLKGIPRSFEGKRYELDSTFTTKAEAKAKMRKLRESGYKTRMHRLVIADIHAIEVYARR